MHSSSTTIFASMDMIRIESRTLWIKVGHQIRPRRILPGDIADYGDRIRLTFSRLQE